MKHIQTGLNLLNPGKFVSPLIAKTAAPSVRV